MNYSKDQSVTAPQLRTIPWARWFGIALAVLLAMAVGIYLWVQSYVTITVAVDTTYLTTPLLADGYPNYLGHINSQNAIGVTPENNAWLAVLRCVGPRELKDEIRAEHFRLLGIAPLPAEGNYLYGFYDYKRLETLPDELLIAASVAAQMPLHVRSARLAALSADKVATNIEQNGFTRPPVEYFDLQERLNNLTSDIAQRMKLTILDPELAAEMDRLDDVPDVDWDPSVAIDEDRIQDLRPAALDPLRPQYLDEEGAAEWRRTQFIEAGKKLLEREDIIISERAWTEAECPLAADWIRRSTPLLDQLQRELIQRPKFYAPWVDESGSQFLVGIDLEWMHYLRQCALGFSYRCRYYMQHQDRAAALRDIQAIFELSRCCSQKPILVEALVAMAIQGIAINALGEWLQQPGITDEELQHVALFLEKRPPLPTLAASISGERIYAVGTVVSLIARKERSLQGDNDTYWESSIVCWDEVLREMNRMYDILDTIVKQGKASNIDQTLAQAYTARPELKELYKQRPWYLLPSQRTEVVKYYYAGLFSPAVNAARNAILKAQVRHDLTRVYVALQRFHLAHQAYPAALSELVPTYIPAVPVDPFDNQPMKYLRTPKGGCRAYSIWSNGVDDGGKPNVGDDDPDFQENDLVFGSPDEIPLKYLFVW